MPPLLAATTEAQVVQWKMNKTSIGCDQGMSHIGLQANATLPGLVPTTVLSCLLIASAGLWDWVPQVLCTLGPTWSSQATP